MKPEKKSVKDLTDRCGAYTIKVKVIDKTTLQISPKTKSLKYKRITFEDEEGTQIKTTLFNDDVDAYDPVIKEHMEYEISNAKVKPVLEKYRSAPGDYMFQLAFNNQTIIRPVEGASAPPGPVYRTISSIPRTMNLQERFDILGVVIFAEDLREATRKDGQKSKVREIVLADHSTDQTMTISTWADLAIKEGQILKESQSSFQIVGFTRVKASYHKGFSLSTTTSTVIQIDPKDDKAKALLKWKTDHKQLMSDKQKQVFVVRLPDEHRITTTIAALRAKQASATMQEERYWLHVTASEFDRKDIRFYLGCSNCGTRSNQELDAIYDCHACKRDAMISTARMNITFEGVDETGSYMFTAFTEDAEKLVEKKCRDLYEMSYEDQLQYLKDVELKLRCTPFHMQVGPSTQLARSQVLKWVLKTISFDTDHKDSDSQVDSENHL